MDLVIFIFEIGKKQPKNVIFEPFPSVKTYFKYLYQHDIKGFLKIIIYDVPTPYSRHISLIQMHQAQEFVLCRYYIVLFIYY